MAIKIQIKDFMNWKTAMFIFFISAVIAIWVSTSSENSGSGSGWGVGDLFSTSGNAAHKKLMIVDQNSGEISFVNKSIQGINQDKTVEDKIITDAIETIRTDVDDLYSKLKIVLGDDYASSTTGLSDTMKSKTAYSGNNGILGKLRKRVEDIDAVVDSKASSVDMANKISWGASVSIRIANKVLADQNCLGFDNSSTSDWRVEHHPKWCQKNGSASGSAVALNRPGT